MSRIFLFAAILLFPHFMQAQNISEADLLQARAVAEQYCANLERLARNPNDMEAYRQLTLALHADPEASLYNDLVDYPSDQEEHRNMIAFTLYVMDLGNVSIRFTQRPSNAPAYEYQHSTGAIGIVLELKKEVEGETITSYVLLSKPSGNVPAKIWSIHRDLPAGLKRLDALPAKPTKPVETPQTDQPTKPVEILQTDQPKKPVEILKIDIAPMQASYKKNKEYRLSWIGGDPGLPITIVAQSLDGEKIWEKTIPNSNEYVWEADKTWKTKVQYQFTLAQQSLPMAKGTAFVLKPSRTWLWLAGAALAGGATTIALLQGQEMPLPLPPLPPE